MPTDATSPYEPDVGAMLASMAQLRGATVAVMVSSLDGRATVAGRVGTLTGSADQDLLLGLRELAAAVVVGGRTVMAEGYAGLLGEEAQSRRLGRSLPPEPELVIFTRQSPPLPELWRQLRERHPDGLIVCEGGPTLLGMVVAARLVDELVLCLSPRIVDDERQKHLLQQQSGAAPVALELLAVTCADGFLFLRYGL